MQERKQPETLRLRSVMPMLTVNDIQASIAWYRDVLGFVLVEEYKMEGEVRGARLRAGVVEILINQDDFAKGRDRKKGVGLRLYCMTAQEIDQLAAAIRERGGTITQEPQDQSWGARDFAIADPDGFNISISTGVES
jgi:lactoylglutathione lyase